MPSNTLNGFLRHFQRAVLLQKESALTDSKSPGRYINGRDESAFEALVYHHGPMVSLIFMPSARDVALY